MRLKLDQLDIPLEESFLGSGIEVRNVLERRLIDDREKMRPMIRSRNQAPIELFQEVSGGSQEALC